LPLSHSRLADIALVPADVRAYVRHCYIPPSGDPDPLWVNATQASRWQTDGGTLYLGETPETVWAESCRTRAAGVAAADPTGGVGLSPANLAYYAPRPLDAPVDARALFEVSFRVDRLADLTTPQAIAVLVAVGMTEAELIADDYGRCPEVSRYGEANGWHAVRARSAALDGGICIAVMPDHHPESGMWRILASSMRPIVAVAYLTRYRAGERPAWLDGPSSAATAVA
jgi:hypothetical protein